VAHSLRTTGLKCTAVTDYDFHCELTSSDPSIDALCILISVYKNHTILSNDRTRTAAPLRSAAELPPVVAGFGITALDVSLR